MSYQKPKNSFQNLYICLQKYVLVILSEKWIKFLMHQKFDRKKLWSIMRGEFYKINEEYAENTTNRENKMD